MKHLPIVSTHRTPLELAIAEVVDEAKQDLGMSQGVLAERASLAVGQTITQVTVSRVLRGLVPMQVSHAEGFAAALGMSLAALLRLAEGKAPRSADALPVTEGDSGPSPNAAHRRRPRRVTKPSREA